MSGDVHVRFCERPGVRFPRATHLVVMCTSQEDAGLALATAEQQLLALGLRLNPAKTSIRPLEGLQFLGYTFSERHAQMGDDASTRIELSDTRSDGGPGLTASDLIPGVLALLRSGARAMAGRIAGGLRGYAPQSAS